MSDRVRIVEVGPRDGLQNEKTQVSVDARVAFIEALLGAGLQTVEVGAFVSPKAIPQMVGSDEVLRRVSRHGDGEFHVLGTFIGALIIVLGFNGLNIFGAPTFSQFVFQGAILIVAVGLASLGRALAES